MEVSKEDEIALMEAAAVDFERQQEKPGKSSRLPWHFGRNQEKQATCQTGFCGVLRCFTVFEAIRMCFPGELCPRPGQTAPGPVKL
ncbi:hypothetical protein U8335_00700 [Roseiconus lacunae]|uniref:hypothetical protein n=1 Tax=Roseiconus lacunae TaxID=2605694 RepID=UPI00308A47E1|nr:hypothetical protein U8335_00700 [Stieleria sp. HD01]